MLEEKSTDGAPTKIKIIYQRNRVRVERETIPDADYPYFVVRLSRIVGCEIVFGCFINRRRAIKLAKMLDDCGYIKVEPNFTLCRPSGT